MKVKVVKSAADNLSHNEHEKTAFQVGLSELPSAR